MDRRQKKTIIVIALAAVCVILALALVFALPWGRAFAAMGMAAKTPYDYPGSSWYSEDPQIRLTISDDPNAAHAQEDSPACFFDGKESVPVRIIVDPLQSKVVIYRETESDVLSSDNLLIEGEMIRASEKAFSFRVERAFLIINVCSVF